MNDRVQLRRPWWRNARGFSLIEILMAVGILATTVVMIMTSVENSGRLSLEDRDLFQGVLLANNKMVEVENELEADILRGKFPDDLKKEGQFPEPHEHIRWMYEVRKVEIPVGDAAKGQGGPAAGAMGMVLKQITDTVRELKLTVSWGDPEDDSPEVLEKKSVSLTTHLVNLK